MTSPRRRATGCRCWLTCSGPGRRGASQLARQAGRRRRGGRGPNPGARPTRGPGRSSAGRPATRAGARASRRPTALRRRADRGGDTHRVPLGGRPAPYHDAMTEPSSAGFPVTTAFALPGMTVEQDLGVAFGLVVRSMGSIKAMGAGFKAMRQGEVTQYTELLEDSRRHAIHRMIETPGCSAPTGSSRCGSTPRRSASSSPRLSLTARRSSLARPASHGRTPPPAPPPGPRSALDEAGRERLLSLLREHYARGHLDLDEMSRRVGVVLAAAYADQAAAAVTDLPLLGAGSAGPAAARASRPGQRRRHAQRAEPDAELGADPGAVPRPVHPNDHAGLDRPGRPEPPLRAGARRLGGLAEPQAVQRRPQDRLGVAGAAVDRRDGDDHVEDLFQAEVVADFMAALRGGEQRPPGRQYPGPALAEDGVPVAVITVRQELARDVVLAGEERGEPVQPGREDLPGVPPAASPAAAQIASTSSV